MTYFEGIHIARLCQKCTKEPATWMFEGMPPSDPNVVIFVCDDCAAALPRNIFRIARVEDYKTVDIKEALKQRNEKGALLREYLKGENKGA